MAGRRKILIALILGVGLAVCCVGIRTRNSPEYLSQQPGEEKIQEPAPVDLSVCIQDLLAGLPGKALKRLEELERDRPEGAVSASILFWKAEALLALGRSEEAAAAYADYLAQYPDEPNAWDARVRLGQCASPGAAGSAIPTEAVRLPGRRLMAIQVPVLAGENLEQVEQEIAWMARTGFNAVILRVFHNPGDRYHRLVNGGRASGVYFQTSRAPVIADILDDVAEICHARGMKLFAWMTTRMARYGIEERRDLCCSRYNLETKSVKTSSCLDLFNEEAVGHLVGLYRDLASHRIDGILLQDDLVLRYNEGFSEPARRAFLARSGRELQAENLYLKVFRGGDGKLYVGEYGPDFWEWALLKRDRVLDVAQILRAECKKTRPTLDFAVNFYYEALSKEKDALAWLSQDIAAAGERGFDYYSVMAYQRQISAELGIEGEQLHAFMEGLVSKATGLIKEPERIVVKIQIVDWDKSENVAVREIAGYVARDLRVGHVSLAFFPYQPGYPFDDLGRALTSIKQRGRHKYEQ